MPSFLSFEHFANFFLMFWYFPTRKSAQKISRNEHFFLCFQSKNQRFFTNFVLASVPLPVHKTENIPSHPSLGVIGPAIFLPAPAVNVSSPSPAHRGRQRGFLVSRRAVVAFWLAVCRPLARRWPAAPRVAGAGGGRAPQHGPSHGQLRVPLRAVPRCTARTSRRVAAV